jgi:hypothetical protein
MRFIFSIGKRGDSEEIAWPTIISIILLLAFMAVFFLFARNTLSGALINEEIYAKKIALLIDGAQPNTTFVLDVTELNKIAMKSGEKESSYADLIKIDGVNRSVQVSLRLGSTHGYFQKYFTEYNVTTNAILTGEKVLYSIEVKE